MRLGVVTDNPITAADEADLKVTVSITDVRVRPGLGDYAGDLDGRLPLRITDRANGPSVAEAGTAQDGDFRFAIPCAPTTSTTIGSACAVNTTVKAIAPGAVAGGRRTMWAFGKLGVFDGGADATASTAGGNTLFATQGVMVP